MSDERSDAERGVDAAEDVVDVASEVIEAATADNAGEGLAAGLGAAGGAAEGIADNVPMDTEARAALHTAGQVAEVASTVVEAVSGLVGGEGESEHDPSRYVVPESEEVEALREGANAAQQLSGTPHDDVHFHLELSGVDAQLGVRRVNLQEGFNTLPSAHIDVLCEGELPEVKELLGKNCSLSIERNEEARGFRGLVWRASVHESIEGTELRLYVVPALRLFKKNLDSRIYQDKTVAEVVEQIVQEKLGGRQRSVRVELNAEYQTHEYLVQYQESDFNFISRLLEQEGIFFFFDHETDQETLVLVDATRGLENARSNDNGEIPYSHDPEQQPDHESVTQVHRRRQLGATAAAVADYDWTHPQLEVRGEHDLEIEQDPAIEVFDHTDAVSFHRYGGEQYEANTASEQALHRAEILRLNREKWTVESTAVGARPGTILNITNCPDGFDDGRYAIVSAHAHGDATPGRGGAWSNELHVVPVDVPYRPGRTTPRPIVPGPLTATVVGPGEIHTDVHGRVKVHFHWDRHHEADAERSSCWIRVQQNWAGPGFGTFFLPRVGMEVVVSFLGGNPDRPLVTGCVYNGRNRHSADLDADKTQSYVRTKSSENSDGYNELRFEDAAGSEFISLHAEKDLNETVKNCHSTGVGVDQSNTVGRDQTETIDRDQTLHVKGDRTKNVDLSEFTEIGMNRTETVIGSEDVFIKVNRSHYITNNEVLEVDKGTRRVHVKTGEDQETYDGGRDVTVKAHDNLHVVDGANRNEVVDGQYNITVDGAHYTLVQGDTEKFTQGSQKTYVESAKEFHVKTGSSHLLMKNDGNVKVSGATKFEAEFGSCKIAMTTSTITLTAGASSIELGPSGITTSGRR